MPGERVKSGMSPSLNETGRADPTDPGSEQHLLDRVRRGRAEALAYDTVEAQADPLDPTTKYFLNRFIDDYYSRRGATVEQAWPRALRFLTTTLAHEAFRLEVRLPRSRGQVKAFGSRHGVYIININSCGRAPSTASA